MTISSRLVLSTSSHGSAAATTSTPITTRSVHRWVRRETSRNAPIGPSTHAAFTHDQTAGERRHHRSGALQPLRDEHQPDQVLRGLMQPERP